MVGVAALEKFRAGVPAIVSANVVKLLSVIWFRRKPEEVRPSKSSVAV